MSLQFRPLAAAVMLACSCASAQAAPAALENLNLLDQAGALPDGFQDHFFDVPLVLRIERDGDYLGDARALLTRDNTIRLIDFTDSSDSTQPNSERERWLSVLAAPRPLGACAQQCDSGLVQLHYSLESSLLSIATEQGRVTAGQTRHHALPEGGSRGLILRHHLNAYGGEGFRAAGRYALDLQGSIGLWTTNASYQVDRSGAADGDLRHAVQSLYAQREFNDHFLRVGYFLPNFQGVTRQPRAPGSVSYTTMGFMAGSSDSLRIDSQAASIYPVYVTANREGSVEVYRDGALIYTQSLQPGLQQLDTRRLPGGIYEVELRVIEDGRETSRENSLIHKPTHWRDPSQRWRYSVFAGQQRSLFDSFQDPDEGELAVGGILNYLAHPRVVVGLAAQQTGDERAVATSMDWHANDRVNLYTNAYTSDRHGHGVDFQGLLRYSQGTVTLSHNRSWQERRIYQDGFYPPVVPEQNTQSGWLHSSAVSLNHRVSDAGSLAARVSHSRGVSNGAGLDVSFTRRQKLFGSDATWRASVFDRPGSISSGQRRNRGVDFTLNLSLGQDGRRYSGSLGTRTGQDGGRDLYASAGIQQNFNGAPISRVGAQASLDSEGVGVSANANFQHPALIGDAYAQRSSSGGQLSGGVNLESTFAIGGGKLAMSGALHGDASTGMILDVSSDLPAVALRAIDNRGGSYLLRPGRNFLPVTAYRSGNLQIDFDGRAAPAAAIQPASLDYHLNKGGVAYGKVDVLSTVTVMGNLRGADGKPLGGAYVINHAGRSVTEADGFFTLQMSARQPTLTVEHAATGGCELRFDVEGSHLKDDVLLAGNVVCAPAAHPVAVADNGETSRAQAK